MTTEFLNNIIRTVFNVSPIVFGRFPGKNSEFHRYSVLQPCYITDRVSKNFYTTNSCGKKIGRVELGDLVAEFLGPYFQIQVL